ncbi:MAG TPA: amidohydrolase family protein [Woeseiaceae bacterium]|nr:amidohydrolase family protein [Woeseiaceae bacterium]
MRKISRRKLLHTAGAALPLGLLGVSEPGRAAAPGSHADTVVRRANMLTMDPSAPKAEALAVSGQHILAVGSDADITNLIGPNTRVIDAAGMTVVPGFIDGHSHPIVPEHAVSVNVNLPRIVDVKDALRRQAAKTPPGHWVRGVMYDDTKFEDERPLNRRDIDEAVPDHPVFVGHRGGHTGVINSKAFEVAGISMDTPDPVGGKYYRENGEFTGKVAELAIETLFEHGTWPVIDRKVRQDSVRVASERMASYGLTSTTDAWGERESLVALQDARAAGGLNFRVSLMPFGGGEFYQSLKNAGIRSGFGDDMIRIGAVKFSADGSASERTMRMSTPYLGRPDDYGISTMTQEAIDAAVDDAVAHDFRVGIHANGDVTIDMVLNAYERVLNNHQGENPRFRIEHCSLVNPELLTRIKATGTIPFPFYTYAYFHGNKWTDYGPEKMEHMFAHRSFLDHGIPVAPASDYPPGPFEPMMAIQSMVTRQDMRGRVWGPSQRISVSEALRICTVHGAYSSFEEHSKGSLTAGKLADFVILDKDPHSVDPNSIIEINVIRTVLGGRTTYEA